MLKFNKKAVSALVAYSLLIGMSIAMAGAVYVWLKFYVANPLPTESCPAEVSMIISDYNCTMPDYPYILNLTVQNRGNFNISGYIVKINNVSTDTGIVGKYPICRGISSCDTGKNDFYKSGVLSDLAPSEINSTLLNYAPIKNQKIAVIQIEPYRNVTKSPGKYSTAYCEKAVITQIMSCG